MRLAASGLAFHHLGRELFITSGGLSVWHPHRARLPGKGQEEGKKEGGGLGAGTFGGARKLLAVGPDGCVGGPNGLGMGMGWAQGDPPGGSNGGAGAHGGEPTQHTQGSLPGCANPPCLYVPGTGAIIKKQSDWVAPILEVFLEEALRWEENGSWRQSVLGSNPVSGWETLTEPPPRHLRASISDEERYASLLPNLPCQLWAAAPPSAALLLRSQEMRGTESA